MSGSEGSMPAFSGSSLGSNPDINQKYKIGDISKGIASTLQLTKKIYKKIYLQQFIVWQIISRHQ
jgi:hypothetical protein